AAKPAAPGQHPQAVPPDLVELILECLVSGHVAELPGVIVVLLERPVGGRGNDQVNGLVGKPTEVAGIPEAQRTVRLRVHGRESSAGWVRVYHRTAPPFKVSRHVPPEPVVPDGAAAHTAT